MWGALSFNEKHLKLGVDIDSWFDWCETLNQNSTIFFHNIKFDGEFLINAFIRKGYVPVKFNFTSTVNKGQFRFFKQPFGFLTLQFRNRRNKLIKLNCSYALLAMSVSSLMGVKEKDKIDYHKYNDFIPKHISEIDKEDIDYLIKDLK